MFLVLRSGHTNIIIIIISIWVCFGGLVSLFVIVVVVVDVINKDTQSLASFQQIEEGKQGKDCCFLLLQKILFPFL